MANNKTVDVLLRYKIDSASVNSVRASFDNLETELDQLRADLLGVGTSAQRGVTGLRQQFDRGQTSIVDMQGEVEQLRADLLRLDDVTVTPEIRTQQTGGAGGAGLAGGLSTVDQIGRIGTQVGGGLGATALGNSVNLIGDVAGAAATMNPVLIGATAAISAVSLVTLELTRAYEEAKKAADDYLVKQTEINLLLAEGDIEGLEARRDQLIADIEARTTTAEGLRSLSARYDELTGAINAENVQAGLNLVDVLVDIKELDEEVSAATDGRITSSEALRDSLVAFDEETQTLEGNLSLVEIALAGAAEEAAEFSSKIEDVVLNPLRAGVSALTTVFTPFVNQINTARQIIEGFNTASGIFGPIIENIRDGLAGIADKARAAAAQLKTDQGDAYLTAITNTVTAQEQLRKAQDVYNEAVNASAGRISEIGAKLQTDLSEAEADRQRDLADAAREAGEERVKATEDAEQERARIQKRFEKSYGDAVAERDALAAKRAEDQRDDELDQLDERYAGQLKTVDDSLKKQQAIISARYQQQVQTANAAAQAAVRTEQAAQQARLTTLQQGVQAAQVGLQNALYTENAIRNTYYNQSIGMAEVWSNTLSLYTARAFNLGGTTGSYTGGGGRVLPTPMAAGGPMMPGRPYWVGEHGPELVTPTRPGYVNPTGTGFAVNINVSGATTETIRAVSRQQALATFGRVLDTMGVN